MNNKNHLNKFDLTLTSNKVFSNLETLMLENENLLAVTEEHNAEKKNLIVLTDQRIFILGEDGIVSEVYIDMLHRVYFFKGENEVYIGVKSIKSEEFSITVSEFDSFSFFNACKENLSSHVVKEKALEKYVPPVEVDLKPNKNEFTQHKIYEFDKEDLFFSEFPPDCNFQNNEKILEHIPCTVNGVIGILTMTDQSIFFIGNLNGKYAFNAISKEDLIDCFVTEEGLDATLTLVRFTKSILLIEEVSIQKAKSVFHRFTNVYKNENYGLNEYKGKYENVLEAYNKLKYEAQNFSNLLNNEKLLRVNLSKRNQDLEFQLGRLESKYENLLKEQEEAKKQFQFDKGKLNEESILNIMELNSYQKRNLRALFLECSKNPTRSIPYRKIFEDKIFGKNSKFGEEDLLIFEEKGFCSISEDRKYVRINPALKSHMFFDTHIDLLTFKSIRYLTDKGNLRNAFQSMYEFNLWNELAEILGMDYFLTTKMRLADVVKPLVTMTDEEKNLLYRGHFDFVIFDRKTLVPMFVVECDGPTHEVDTKAEINDRLKESISRKVKLPLIRISTSEIDNKLVYSKINYVLRNLT